MCTCFVEECGSWVLFLKKAKGDNELVASAAVFRLVLQNSSLPKHVVIHEFSLKLFSKVSVTCRSVKWLMCFVIFWNCKIFTGNLLISAPHLHL